MQSWSFFFVLRQFFGHIAFLLSKAATVCFQNSLRRRAPHPLWHSKAHENEKTFELSISIIWCIRRHPAKGDGKTTVSSGSRVHQAGQLGIRRFSDRTAKSDCRNDPAWVTSPQCSSTKRLSAPFQVGPIFLFFLYFSPVRLFVLCFCVFSQFNRAAHIAAQICWSKVLLLVH